MSSGAVAVIDIGSNSIKVLVAARASDGSVAALAARTIDARISAGINRSDPRLGEDGMARGVDAIRALLAEAKPYSPVRTVLVATSAVRDARNGAEFCERVKAATGHEIRILSGHEEASLIGRGLTCDPALRDLRNFYVFDLGGGSLECLAFRERQIDTAVSLQLGCVRLTERFLRDPNAPFPASAGAEITAHTRGQLEKGFTFALPSEAVAVGTGGTFATVRAIRAARDAVAFETTSPVVTVAELRELLARLAPMPLPERRLVPGLPPPRADVFPTALATLIAVADVGRFTEFQNSLYNLRYGVADEALA